MLLQEQSVWRRNILTPLPAGSCQNYTKIILSIEEYEPNTQRHLSLCEYLLLKEMCIICLIIFSFPLGNFHELIWCMQLGHKQVSVTEDFLTVFWKFFLWMWGRIMPLKFRNADGISVGSVDLSSYRKM